MKLYNEEQVRKAINIKSNNIDLLTSDNIIASLTHIELPSDEEIKAQVEPMETKQTAIDWLINIVQSCIAPDYIPKEIINQAKAMEKEQIKDAWKDSNYHRASENVLEYSSNEYYEETYGK